MITKKNNGYNDLPKDFVHVRFGSSPTLKGKCLLRTSNCVYAYISDSPEHIASENDIKNVFTSLLNDVCIPNGFKRVSINDKELHIFALDIFGKPIEYESFLESLFPEDIEILIYNIKSA